MLCTGFSGNLQVIPRVQPHGSGGTALRHLSRRSISRSNVLRSLTACQLELALELSFFESTPDKPDDLQVLHYI